MALREHVAAVTDEAPRSHPFAVWAPTPSRVDLVVDGERYRMAQDSGWWKSEILDVEGDADYAFILDGRDPVPDPRSPHQPRGVHGPSRTVDHGAFRWTDQEWKAPSLETAVVYEMHVGTFTPDGSFDSAIDRLPHLVRLGITHVELMPVAAFPGARGWGYDGVALWAPHHAYGGPSGLKRLVDACHAHNLAIILDVVYNHLGPAGNYLGQFGPYFTPRYRTPWGDAVNLDGEGSDEVRRFLCDNALMWVRDYHMDGLRLDAVHALVDTSAVPLLEQLSQTVDDFEERTGRYVALIAESDLNDPRVVRGREAYGCGIDAQWSDDFHHALHVGLTGERSGYYADFSGMPDVVTALTGSWVYTGQYSRYRGRRHGRAPIDVPRSRFLGYLQNHDQIGNRARGDRSSHLLSSQYLRIAAALVLTAPFIPLLFQGEEWGASTPFQYFVDHDDPGLAEAIRDGRQREFAAFGWQPHDVPDPQAVETYERSKLDWREAEDGEHAALLTWHHRLIALRRTFDDLGCGGSPNIEPVWDASAQTLLVRRGTFTVACNFAEVERPAELGAEARVVLTSAPGVVRTDVGTLLPPVSVTVFRDTS